MCCSNKKWDKHNNIFLDMHIIIYLGILNDLILNIFYMLENFFNYPGNPREIIRDLQAYFTRHSRKKHSHFFMVMATTLMIWTW